MSSKKSCTKGLSKLYNHHRDYVKKYVKSLKSISKINKTKKKLNKIIKERSDEMVKKNIELRNELDSLLKEENEMNAKSPELQENAVLFCEKNAKLKSLFTKKMDKIKKTHEKKKKENPEAVEIVDLFLDDNLYW